jgi:branched-chain amino acid transport system ATP-binding protein
LTTAVQKIWLDHININSVLACLRHLVAQIDEGGRQPDFGLVASIIDYMEGFPAKVHHPKEEDHLFPALLRRRPDIAPMLEKVRDEHVLGAKLLAGLRAALDAFERDPAKFARFQDAALTYDAFERRHMAREERELLPLAMAELRAEDWDRIDEAFDRNEDPLFGTGRKAEFEALFQHILNCAAGPTGVGDDAVARPG